MSRHAQSLRRAAAVLALSATTMAAGTPSAQPPGAQPPNAVLRDEFIGDQPRTPSAHASTIVETPIGLLAAWFGGTREGAPDVGIWMSRYTGGRWSDATEVANGVQSDGRRFACYNPVLFYSADRVLHLFYKVGAQPATWWGMHQTSRDDGATWSAAERLPDGILGPIKNKPVVLADSTIVAGSSTESIDATPTWRVHFEISRDNGRTWVATGNVRNANDTSANVTQAIQPALLRHNGGSLQAVVRTRSSAVFETWSFDNGRTWSPLSLTTLPNPNSGLDALTLRDGRSVVVYNPSIGSRTPLAIALSSDRSAWHQVLMIEIAGGEHSYPAVIQTADGLLHITYTWERTRIKHVVVDPARLR